MSDITDKVAALLDSPLGCTFLHLAHSTGLTPHELSIPPITLYIGAWATKAIDVWRGNYQRLAQEIVRRGPKYASLAEALLEEEGSAWWFGPIDRGNQINAPRWNLAPDPKSMAIPKDPPSNLERYSQQVFRGLLTSSEINGFTSLFATLDCGAGDVRGGYLNPPYQNWRLMVNESARVLEIDGPQSWHNLCMAYPAKKSPNLSHPDFSGDAGQIVPDWAMVKSDWDAVHLTFGGLLTAEQVRVQSPDGWTYLWGWNSELTLWLRWAFTSVEHLPDYVPRRPSFLPNLGFLEKLLR